MNKPNMKRGIKFKRRNESHPSATATKIEAVVTRFKLQAHPKFHVICAISLFLMLFSLLNRNSYRTSCSSINQNHERPFSKEASLARLLEQLILEQELEQPIERRSEVARNRLFQDRYTSTNGSSNILMNKKLNGGSGRRKRQQQLSKLLSRPRDLLSSFVPYSLGKQLTLKRPKTSLTVRGQTLKPLNELQYRSKAQKTNHFAREPQVKLNNGKRVFSIKPNQHHLDLINLPLMLSSVPLLNSPFSEPLRLPAKVSRLEPPISIGGNQQAPSLVLVGPAPPIYSTPQRGSIRVSSTATRQRNQTSSDPTGPIMLDQNINFSDETEHSLEVMDQILKQEFEQHPGSQRADGDSLIRPVRVSLRPINASAIQLPHSGSMPPPETRWSAPGLSTRDDLRGQNNGDEHTTMSLIAPIDSQDVSEWTPTDFRTHAKKEQPLRQQVQPTSWNSDENPSFEDDDEQAGTFDEKIAASSDQQQQQTNSNSWKGSIDYDQFKEQPHFKRPKLQGPDEPDMRVLKQSIKTNPSTAISHNSTNTLVSDEAPNSPSKVLSDFDRKSRPHFSHSNAKPERRNQSSDLNDPLIQTVDLGSSNFTRMNRHPSPDSSAPIDDPAQELSNTLRKLRETRTRIKQLQAELNATDPKMLHQLQHDKPDAEESEPMDEPDEDYSEERLSSSTTTIAPPSLGLRGTESSSSPWLPAFLANSSTWPMGRLHNPPPPAFVPFGLYQNGPLTSPARLMSTALNKAAQEVASSGLMGSRDSSKRFLFGNRTQLSSAPILLGTTMSVAAIEDATAEPESESFLPTLFGPPTKSFQPAKTIKTPATQSEFPQVPPTQTGTPPVNISNLPVRNSNSSHLLRNLQFHPTNETRDYEIASARKSVMRQNIRDLPSIQILNSDSALVTLGPSIRKQSSSSINVTSLRDKIPEASDRVVSSTSVEQPPEIVTMGSISELETELKSMKAANNSADSKSDRGKPLINRPLLSVAPISNNKTSEIEARPPSQAEYFIPRFFKDLISYPTSLFTLGETTGIRMNDSSKDRSIENQGKLRPSVGIQMEQDSYFFLSENFLLRLVASICLASLACLFCILVMIRCRISQSEQESPPDKQCSHHQLHQHHCGRSGESQVDLSCLDTRHRSGGRFKTRDWGRLMLTRGRRSSWRNQREQHDRGCHLHPQNQHHLHAHDKLILDETMRNVSLMARAGHQNPEIALGDCENCRHSQGRISSVSSSSSTASSRLNLVNGSGKQEQQLARQQQVASSTRFYSGPKLPFGAASSVNRLLSQCLHRKEFENEKLDEASDFSKRPTNRQAMASDLQISDSCALSLEGDEAAVGDANDRGGCVKLNPATSNSTEVKVGLSCCPVRENQSVDSPRQLHHHQHTHHQMRTVRPKAVLSRDQTNSKRLIADSEGRQIGLKEEQERPNKVDEPDNGDDERLHQNASGGGKQVSSELARDSASKLQQPPGDTCDCERAQANCITICKKSAGQSQHKERENNFKQPDVKASASVGDLINIANKNSHLASRQALGRLLGLQESAGDIDGNHFKRQLQRQHQQRMRNKPEVTECCQTKSNDDSCKLPNKLKPFKLNGLNQASPKELSTTNCDPSKHQARGKRLQVIRTRLDAISRQDGRQEA